MIFAYWGEDKTCKDTLGLSFPKPLQLMEFDIGGFHRACRNLPHAPIKDWYEAGLIRVEQLVLPFQTGKFDVVHSTVGPVKTVKGVKELYYEFLDKFINHLQDPDIATIMLDTGTILYFEVVCQGYLQELQEKQLPLKPNGLGADGKQFRQQLQQQEYKEPNLRMGPLAYQAKAHGKHLVVSHHATDEYGLTRKPDGTIGQGPTGKRIMHGWKKWGHVADIVGNTWWDAANKKAMLTIEVAEVKELEGMVLENPTYDTLSKLIAVYRG